MLEFKKITLEDKSTIDRLLEGNTYRSSECCFSNLYGWSHKFNTSYAEWNNFLLVKFTVDNGGCSYLIPYGQGDLKPAIEVLMNDCGCTQKFSMSGVTERMWTNIETSMPGMFEKIPVRSGFDYIYTSEKLIHLNGKKLQSKRNHINRFKKENNWEYQSLVDHPEYLEKCRKMLRDWIDINLESHDESLELDYITTSTFLTQFKELDLRGGVIMVDGKIAAFTLGRPLTDDTFIVHAEKAFTNINGAYSIINQQFVEHEASGFNYINREEDMGYESLRKAKMSYQPDILLEKSILKLKQ
ncbi:MAG: phosphatidylglycerol lysyltransferase domain-containing protein [Dysgonamonadaceae bacterium]